MEWCKKSSKEQLSFRSEKAITSGKGGSDKMGKVILSASRTAQTQIWLHDDLIKDESLFSILYCFSSLNPNKIFFVLFTNVLFLFFASLNETLQLQQWY